MAQLKRGQRYLRTYTDGGGPTLLLEVTQDSPEGRTSARARIVQKFDLDKNLQHSDWTGYEMWAFLGSWTDIKYTYLVGQDAPQ